jgi:AcrR family transcriptional regulator
MDRKKELIEVALKLFVENGFHGTATAKIAKEANVANGTLFQYFATKEALIVAVFKEVKGELADLLAEESTGKPVKDLLKIQFTSSIRWALKNIQKFQYIQQFYSSPYIQLMEQTDIKKYIEPHLSLIREGIETNTIRRLDVELVYQLFSSQTFGVIQYLITGKKKNQEKIIEESFLLLWDMFKVQ